MTNIVPGMTPVQYITAMNDNATLLATAWGVNADSFLTLTTSNASPSNINYNLRGNVVAYGQKASTYLSGLNLAFASIVHRFQDNLLENIMSPLTAYGEGSALVSDDGNQIDIWFTATITGVTNIYYSYSTDGLTFAAPTKTNIPDGYIRNHVHKVGATYYHYANHGDTTIHLFTSTDKVNYTDQGEVIGLGGVGAWDHLHLGNPFVWNEGGSWFMLYEAEAASGWKIGLATASAPEGPWTKYGSNPVITGVEGIGNPEMPRVNNVVIKNGGNYVVYCHYGDTFLTSTLVRLYSADLHTWVNESALLDSRRIHGNSMTYGDQCLVQFKGKSYLMWSPSNQVNASHVDIGVDNRPLAELLALYP
jgi:hypothetical protein